MARSSDDRAVPQADFERMSGASRDDWRKWERRRLVNKPKGRYGWRHVVQALVLKRLETAAGLDVVLRCWDDIQEDVLSMIHQPIVDVVIDPGTSAESAPGLRARISTDDETTLLLARQAGHPWILALGPAIAAARGEFERVTRLLEEHADHGTRAGGQRHDRGATAWS